MSWKTENFRDEAHRVRAQQLRNKGITSNPHASWKRAAAAKRKANRDMANPHHKVMAEIRFRHRWDVQQAIDAYCRAAFPERFESLACAWQIGDLLDAIPF